MQLSVASLQLALVLFAVPTHAGVYAPSLPAFGSANADGDDQQMVVFRVLKSDTVAPSAPRARHYGCKDDPAWVDKDGDGCEVYADAIKSGSLDQDVACGFEANDPDLDGYKYEGDFEGAAFHCRATCGTCPAASEPPSSAQQPEATESDGTCIDDPTWTDEDGDGCDVYAMHIKTGDLPRSVACGFEDSGDKIDSGNPQGAAQHCRATCGTCDGPKVQDSNWQMNVAEQIVAESPFQAGFDPALLSSERAEEGKSCQDDPDWVDMDGDGCEAYAKAIASGPSTQDELCGRAHLELISGNPGEAAKYCPATCGNCHLEQLQDNDIEMKDMIRLLVEQESESILKSANLQEAEEEEEEVPEVTTTTTTAAKKLPEAEMSTNSTWMEYWAPEADEVPDQEDLSHLDLLKMASDFQPQQRPPRWLHMLSSQ
jgi:hypothetical protein